MSFIPAIDVSQYQGTIDWSKIGEPIALIKMSGGDAKLYMDTQAAHNYDSATGHGKAVGGYHFAGGTDPVTEARYFMNAMAPLVEHDVYVLDWEIQHADPVGWCTTFMETVHNKIGVWPLLYLNLSTLNAYDWSPVLATCGLWLADWAVSPDTTIPTHHTYVMQQYNDGPWCDHDAWFGTIEEFRQYGWHAPAVTPPTPTLPSPAPAPAPVATPVEPTPPATPAGQGSEQTTNTEAPQPAPSPEPVPEPVPEPTPAPEPAPAPSPEPKVVVPEPTYYGFLDLLLAILKKLFGRH